MSGQSGTKKIILWVVGIALFMESLDVTILTTAIPKMAMSFSVDPVSLKMALTSYLLGIAFFLPISGWVADKWGTQKTFICALSLFTLSSIGCGLSRNLTELVIARIFQGMGGAFMMPVGNLIILRAYPKSELEHAMNFVLTPLLFGPLLGPLVGGFITTYYSWPWVFFVNVPMGCLGIVAARRFIQNYKHETLRPFDTLGFILFGFTLAAAYVAFEMIGEKGVPSSVILCAGLLFLGGLILFYRHYRKTPFAVLSFNLFGIRTFSFAVSAAAWTRLCVGSVPFLMPLFFQIGYGLSPLHSGLLTGSWTLGVFCVKPVNKMILRRFGFKRLLIALSLLTGLSIVLFSLISDVNILLILLLNFFYGIAGSMHFFNLSILSYADVPPENMGDATSMTGTLLQLTIGFAIAIGALVLRVLIGGNQELQSGNTHSFRMTFLILGALSTLSSLIYIWLKPEDGKAVANQRI
ncbi:MAG: MFS transporter [Rhabdochlamydiaceae bacterium]|nr:MFS transporter [Rhabdochlamydiaceae bacterium]